MGKPEYPEKKKKFQRLNDTKLVVYKQKCHIIWPLMSLYWPRVERIRDRLEQAAQKVLWHWSSALITVVYLCWLYSLFPEERDTVFGLSSRDCKRQRSLFRHEGEVVDSKRRCAASKNGRWAKSRLTQMYQNVGPCKCQGSLWYTPSTTTTPPPPPQWGAADAELKSHPVTTQLKRSPFKSWSRSVYSHTCCAYCQEFLPYFYPSSPFTCISSITSPYFFMRWLLLTPVPV